MKLSIIVPAYNCSDYLEECLDSILGQLMEDGELIIVDDGSDDDTVQMIMRYKNDSRVKILLRSHEGVSGARNAGIDVAEGDYIGFVDCDDYLEKDFLKKAKELMNEEPDLIIFGFERCFLNGDSRLSTVEDHFYPDISSFADEYIRKRIMLIYSACNKFYNKKIIDKYHIRFETGLKFGEDRIFNYAYLMRAQTIVTSKLIMFKYMQRASESMSTWYVPDYFKLAYHLHEEKMKCFLTLSKGTNRTEREDFVNYNLRNVIIYVINRFEDNPEEMKENLPLILEMVYGKSILQEVPPESSWVHKPCDNEIVSKLL
ncbi:glycosyltransferase family 2 protein [Butyrivibrio sp. WCE2006]|uniref:glycosyltransferase family 2 protein n=1 Tax=Butyrivibrio sp. WCE2006 TaxID=1410611 RepID=UPI0005D24024|nr:glycosyltransferase family 2 protein [Butyrivibrio sp. WCE2006]